MALAEGLVRNPVKVAVGVILLVLFGSIALMRMPMQLTPEVLTPTITIETTWPGASPQEVEREIVQEQEEQLKGVEGVTKMSSECQDSLGTINLEFPVGTDMSQALIKVNSRLQQVPEYPTDANEPVMSESRSSDTPIAWLILRPRVASNEEIAAFQKRHPELADVLEPVRRAYTPGLALRRLQTIVEEHPAAAELLPPPMEIDKMRRFAEDAIEARFERVAGVSNANVFGGRDEELHVIVDPYKLAARGLTIGAVRRALIGRNKDTSAGDFWEGKRRYVVRTLGQLKSIEEVEGVLLARLNDVSVYVRDVAEVRLGHRKPEGLVRNFGTPCIAINCQRATGANVVETMEGIRAAAAELNAGVLPARGLMLVQVYDETEYIHSAVGLVRQNIFIGGFLTICVLLLFLRSARSTLVIALTIPSSILGTFLFLGLMGRSLNVISLAGLAFAVGMLVDNAVVVLENIYRHYQLGERRFVAAVKGTQEVWGAVLASTLTTLAVFLPVLFVEEEAGQLFRDIALAISCSVGLSLLISVTLIPTTAARILPKHTAHHKGPGRTARMLAAALKPVDRMAGLFVDFVIGFNAWVQRRLLRKVSLVAVLVGGALGLSFAMFPKVDYLPTGNRNLVLGIVIPPLGYNLDQLAAIGTRIEDNLRPYWDVDPDSPEAAKLDGPVIGNFFYVARRRQVFMGAMAVDPLRAKELEPILLRAASGEPGTTAFTFQTSLFEGGLKSGRSIDVEITGPDIAQLIGIGQRVTDQLMDMFHGQYPRASPSLELSNPEVHVIPNWEKAADLGVTAAELGFTVDALVDGAYAGDYFVGGDKIDLRIVGREQDSGSFQDIRQLPVATPSGDVVPLGSLATVRLSSGPEQINRRERVRSVTLELQLPASVPLEDAMERIDAGIVQPLARELGDAVRIQLAGTADKLRATWQALSFNILLAVLITYLLMAALFESWLYPFIVILSVPMGAVGGFAGLALLNLWRLQTLDVLTMLGFVILIGTVVNNAILIVHQSLRNVREDGLDPHDAILASVRTRIRPIFMTTFTTTFGLLPLVLFPGAGSELYRGLGSVVLGGLLCSTVFTLFLVPTLLSMTLRARAPEEVAGSPAATA